MEQNDDEQNNNWKLPFLIFKDGKDPHWQTDIIEKWGVKKNPNYRIKKICFCRQKKLDIQLPIGIINSQNLMSEKRTFYNDSKSWAAGQQKAFVVKNHVEINIDKPACQLQRQKTTV
jgi:hypothetical protein